MPRLSPAMGGVGGTGIRVQGSHRLAFVGVVIIQYNNL